MRRRRLRGALLALSLLAIPTLGCEAKKLQIQLESFFSSEIDGIFLFRADTLDGPFERVCEIRFSDFRTIVRRGNQVERIRYLQNCLDGQQGTPALLLETTARHPEDGDPDAILLELWYLRFEPTGFYKATAFNAAGESPLSVSALPL